jgi:two-component system chemotaxis sensor kinase CheA
LKPEFADMTEAFDEESRDLLDAMEESLLDIQENGMNKENMSAVFRAAHTVKGAAGMFELEYLVKFTHVAENLLDEIRNGRIDLTDEILNLFFEVKDQMQLLVDFAVEDEDGDTFTARSAGLDIVMASFDAVIKAVNYLMLKKKKRR